LSFQDKFSIEYKRGVNPYIDISDKIIDISLIPYIHRNQDYTQVLGSFNLVISNIDLRFMPAIDDKVKLYDTPSGGQKANYFYGYVADIDFDSYKQTYTLQIQNILLKLKDYVLDLATLQSVLEEDVILKASNGDTLTIGKTYKNTTEIAEINGKDSGFGEFVADASDAFDFTPGKTAVCKDDSQYKMYRYTDHVFTGTGDGTYTGRWYVTLFYLLEKILKIAIDEDTIINSLSQLFGMDLYDETKTSTAISRKKIAFDLHQLYCINQEKVFNMPYRERALYSVSKNPDIEDKKINLFDLYILICQALKLSVRRGYDTNESIDQFIFVSNDEVVNIGKKLDEKTKSYIAQNSDYFYKSESKIVNQFSFPLESFGNYYESTTSDESELDEYVTDGEIANKKEITGLTNFMLYNCDNLLNNFPNVDYFFFSDAKFKPFTNAYEVQEIIGRDISYQVTPHAGVFKMDIDIKKEVVNIRNIVYE
jgi:hypothetical protein